MADVDPVLLDEARRIHARMQASKQVPTKTEAFGEGVRSGLGLGASDVLAGVSGALGNAYDNLVNGVDPSFQTDAQDAYFAAHDEALMRRRAAEQAHPYVEGAGEVVGALPMALRSAAKGAKFIGDVNALRGMAQLAPMGRLATLAATGAAGSAPLAALGAVNAAASPEDIPGEAVERGLVGGALGAGLSVVGPEVVSRGASLVQSARGALADRAAAKAAQAAVAPATSGPLDRASDLLNSPLAQTLAPAPLKVAGKLLKAIGAGGKSVEANPAQALLERGSSTLSAPAVDLASVPSMGGGTGSTSSTAPNLFAPVIDYGDELLGEAPTLLRTGAAPAAAEPVGARPKILDVEAMRAQLGGSATRGTTENMQGIDPSIAAPKGQGASLKVQAAQEAAQEATHGPVREMAVEDVPRIGEAIKRNKTTALDVKKTNVDDATAMEMLRRITMNDHPEGYVRPTARDLGDLTGLGADRVKALASKMGLQLVAPKDAPANSYFDELGNLKPEWERAVDESGVSRYLHRDQYRHALVEDVRGIIARGARVLSPQAMQLSMSIAQHPAGLPTSMWLKSAAPAVRAQWAQQNGLDPAVVDELVSYWTAR